jgi:hypothetical protein
MRSRVKKTGVLILFAVGLLLIQNGIQLLHHHYNNSYHDTQDGFHTLDTAATCPAKTVCTTPKIDFQSLISTAFVVSSPIVLSYELKVPDVKQLPLSSPVPTVGSRAPPA